MSEEKITGYSLSRHWFDFCFENPEKIRPVHTAIYTFAIEHWNRLGQKEKFGFPSQMTMDAIGVKSYNTYIPAFHDLVEWGFFKLIEKSKNQYSSNIIALSKIDKAHDKALDKAFAKHLTKHMRSTSQSTCSIDKPLNNEQKNNEPLSAGAPERELGDFSKRLEKADSKIDLFDLWFEYRKEKGRHPSLHEKDVLLNRDWSDKSVKKIAEAISYTVKNGWFSLQYPEGDDQRDDERFDPELARRVRGGY